MPKKIAVSFALITSMALIFCVNAFAYLDPSAMTYVIQAVAGVVIAGGAAIIIYWRKIKLFFKKRKMKNIQAAAEANKQASDKDKSED